MKYTQENFLLAEKLFSYPIQRGLSFSPCRHCGELVTFGYKHPYQKINEAMHPDCFLVSLSERMPRCGPFASLFQIEEVDKPKVVIKQSVMKKLISAAVDFFPYQHNFFSIGEEMGDKIIINDFVDVPFLKYEMPEGEFSNYGIDDSEEALKKLDEILTKGVTGYIHSHDTGAISVSDALYDCLYWNFLPERYRSLRIRGQLDIFWPTFKQLILLNHRRFKGECSLLVQAGKDILPTDNFYRYIRPVSKKDRKIAKAAKESAKNAIISNISQYFSVYSTILDIFIDLGNSEMGKIIKELNETLSKPILEIKDVANARLTKLIKGRIKELPLDPNFNEV